MPRFSNWGQHRPADRADDAGDMETETQLVIQECVGGRRASWGWANGAAHDSQETSAAGDRYLQLIREFPLRPLRLAADLNSAVAMLDAATDRGELDEDERDYLQVLAGLVHDYESEHDPLPDMSPVEALRYLLDENGMTQAQLSEQTGIAVATISEILNDKRGISPTVRKALARRFKVDAALFV